MAVDVERIEQSFFVPFVKTVQNDDGTVTVIGKPSTETVDFDDQIVDKDFMKRALPQWMAGWANIREMHQPKAVGKGERLEWDENDEPWLTAKIVDPDAVKKVREGVLQGFSVGIYRPKVRPDPKARGGRIVDGREIHEVSLVDRPANPDCSVSVLKMVNGSLAATKAIRPDEGGHATGGVPDIAGDGHYTDDATRAGNVRPPTDSNSGDFDSMGNPVLQPGHVRDNSADISIVTMDDRGAVMAVGQRQFVVPYTVESDGMVHFWPDQMEELPFDPKALPDDPREHLPKPGDSGKGAGDMGAAVAVPAPEAGKAVWSTAHINDLPDDAFAYIAPGGKKVDGKTEPRDLRHLPYKDADGKVDAAHVRNALARLDQTDIPDEAKAEARRKLEHAAREVGVEVSEPARSDKIVELKKAAEEHERTHGYCRKCRKSVKLGDKLAEEKGAGGMHATYKGECGHAIKRFEPEAPKAPEGDTADKAGMPAAHKESERVPTGMGPAAGDTKGNTEGSRPAHTDPEDAQERDIAARMQQALRNYALAIAANEEGAEDRALAELTELVNAGVTVQRQEATEGRADHAEGAEQPVTKGLTAEVRAAVKSALAEAMPEIAKMARKRHKDALKDAHKRLGDVINELPDDPLEDHERGVAKASGLGTRPDNPDAAGAPDKDSQVPGGARSGDWAERIHEVLAEVNELARVIAGAEAPLQDGGKDKPGRLEDGKATPAIDKPGNQRWDLNANNGGSTPKGGADADHMHKVAGIDPKAIQDAIAEGIRIGSEQATKAAGAIVADLKQRLATVEHMAAPAREPVQVAERPTEFADPRITKAADEGVRALLASLPEKERQAAAVQLIEQARKGQRR